MSVPNRANLLVEGLLHAGEVERLVAGARPTDAGELPGLRLRVLAYLARVEAMAEGDTSVDVEAARKIGWVLAELCDAAAGLDEQQRALVRGAVEYFVLDRDVVGDTADVVGFDDDARVVNAVTTALRPRRPRDPALDASAAARRRGAARRASRAAPGRRPRAGRSPGRTPGQVRRGRACRGPGA